MTEEERRQAVMTSMRRSAQDARAVGDDERADEIEAQIRFSEDVHARLAGLREKTDRIEADADRTEVRGQRIGQAAGAGFLAGCLRVITLLMLAAATVLIVVAEQGRRQPSGDL